MRAAERADGIHRDRHAEPPARGDDDPPGVLAFRLIEHDVGDHAIAQDDQQHGAEQLCKERRHRVEWEAAKLSAWLLLVYRDSRCHRRRPMLEGPWQTSRCGSRVPSARSTV